MLGNLFLILAAFAIANAAPAELDLDAEEEFLTQEARGLLSKETKGELDECLGNYRNKFLTKITTREEFVECFKSVCSDEFSAVIDQVVDCVGLEEGVGRLEVRALLTKARGGFKKEKNKDRKNKQKDRKEKKKDRKKDNNGKKADKKRNKKHGKKAGRGGRKEGVKKGKMMIMTNRGRLGFCIRETKTKC